MKNNRTLDGIPYRYTQQLPTNLTVYVSGTGGGTQNTGAYLFLVDMADVILAETMNMYVDASDVASYKDAGGNMVSAFTRDQIAFRIIEEHDFNIRHQASVAVATLPPGHLPGLRITVPAARSTCKRQAETAAPLPARGELQRLLA